MNDPKVDNELEQNYQPIFLNVLDVTSYKNS